MKLRSSCYKRKKRKYLPNSEELNSQHQSCISKIVAFNKIQMNSKHIFEFLIILIVSCDILNLNTWAEARPNSVHDKMLQRPSQVEQSFRTTPKEHVILNEGDSYKLECAVDNKSGEVSWTKGLVVVYNERDKVQARFKDRVAFVGDENVSDYSLQIKSARREDAGTYDCQLLPKIDGGGFEGRKAKIATSKVEVRNINQYQQQQPHQQTLPSNKAASQLQARDTDVHLTKLPRHQQGLSSDNSNQTTSNNGEFNSAFITPQASTAAGSSLSAGTASSRGSNGMLFSSSSISSTGVSGYNHNRHHSSSSSLTANLLLCWPYLFMLLAAVLLFVNIYLIISIIARHRERKRNACLSNSESSGTSATSDVSALSGGSI